MWKRQALRTAIALTKARQPADYLFADEWYLQKHIARVANTTYGFVSIKNYRASLTVPPLLEEVRSLVLSLPPQPAGGSDVDGCYWARDEASA